MKTAFANLSKHHQKHENTLKKHQKTRKSVKNQYKHPNANKNWFTITSVPVVRTKGVPSELKTGKTLRKHHKQPKNTLKTTLKKPLKKHS